MLDIASHANRTIKLLSPKQSRARIVKMFKQKMWLLRDRFKVSPFYPARLVDGHFLVSHIRGPPSADKLA